MTETALEKLRREYEDALAALCEASRTSCDDHVETLRRIDAFITAAEARVRQECAERAEGVLTMRLSADEFSHEYRGQHGAKNCIACAVRAAILGDNRETDKVTR